MSARHAFSTLFIFIFLTACSSTEGRGSVDAAADIQNWGGDRDVDLASSRADLGDAFDLPPPSTADLLSMQSDLASSTADLSSSSDDLLAAQPDLAASTDLLPAADLQAAPPTITTFAATSPACPGSILLSYAFSGGDGLVTPGDLPVSAGSGSLPVALSSTTEYTLTVTGPGGVKTQKVTVTALPTPNATITAPANAAVKETFAVSVPTQSGATYAWSIVGGPASIKSGAALAQASLDVTAAGGPITVSATVTKDGCSATTQATIALPCGAPLVISESPPGTPEFIPINGMARPPALLGVDEGWAPYLVHKASSGAAVFDYSFTRLHDGVWGPPAGAPHLLNAADGGVRDIKVATNDAGDAVFVWTEINSVYSAKLVAYRSIDDHWSSIKTITNQLPSFQTAVTVHLDHASGDAIVSWIEGPYGTPIPHLRHYDVETDSFGPDLPLRATTTTTPGYVDMMNLDVRLNANLDGMVAWFERDNNTSVVTLNALHVTSGAPDLMGVGPAYDIVPLVIGTTTSIDDPINQWSLVSGASDRQPRTVAVSANGTAAVVWRAYNGLASETDKGTLYTRRFVGGTWQPAEVIAKQPGSFEAWDWGIDDAGFMLVMTLDSSGVAPAGYRVTHAAMGSPFAPLSKLGSVSGSSSLPFVHVDSTSGRGIVTFTDTAIYSGVVVRAAIWNPATQQLGSSFTVGDPTQSTSNGGRPFIDASGEALIVYVQMPNPPPPGGNSTNSGLLFANRCR